MGGMFTDQAAIQAAMAEAANGDPKVNMVAVQKDPRHAVQYGSCAASTSQVTRSTGRPMGIGSRDFNIDDIRNPPCEIFRATLDGLIQHHTLRWSNHVGKSRAAADFDGLEKVAQVPGLQWRGESGNRSEVVRCLICGSRRGSRVPRAASQSVIRSSRTSARVGNPSHCFMS